MNIDPAQLRHARRVADAILYEGYLLYPYRASAQKNQARFQFGVLMPPAYRAVDHNEMSSIQAECLLDCPDEAEVRVLARFLQLQRRTAEMVSPPGPPAVPPGPPAVPPGLPAALDADGAEPAPWDEAVEREQEATASVAALVGSRRDTAFHISGGQATQARTRPVPASPESDHVTVGGVPIARGSRVLMRPGTRRADAQDIFLAGRPALVEAVLHDVDGHVHLAVSPEDDPATELNRLHGRYLYFAPDEVEPIERATPTAAG